MFLKDGETEFKAYKPSEIKGYRLDEGAYYETRTLPVDSVPKTVFAECMIEGGMSLYFYGEGYEKYYYFVDDNGHVAELKCPGTNEANVDKSTKRKLMLAAFNMLSKSKKAQNELWASDFHRSALAKLTREYNNEFCHSNGNCVEYQYNPKAVQALVFKFRVQAGSLFGTLKADFLKSYHRSPLSLSNTGYQIAAGTDILLPRFSDALSFQALLAFTHMDSKKNVTDVTYKAHVSMLGLQLGAVYDFIPKGKISPFVRAGLNIDDVFKPSQENMRKEGFLLATEGNNGLDMGCYAGAGVDVVAGKQVLRVGVDYENHGGFGKSNYGTNYQGVSVKLGLRF